jgi:hypothetical protein
LNNKYPKTFTRKTKEQKLIPPRYDSFHDDEYKKACCWCDFENEIKIDEMLCIIDEISQMEI